MADKQPIIFNMKTRDEVMYSLGKDRYVEQVRRHSLANKINDEQGGVDADGLARDLRTGFGLLQENEQTAILYFIAWNRFHPEDFEAFLNSDDAKIPGVTDEK